METASKQAVYPGVDLFKFLFSLLPVISHMTFLAGYSEFGRVLFGEAIGRGLIPYFTIASSFFLFRKLNTENPHSPENRRLFAHRMFSLLSLYLIWSGLYALINIPLQLRDVGARATAIWLGKALLYKGVSEVLWFFPALMVSLLLVYLLLGRLRVRGILIAGGICYGIGLCLSTYSALLMRFAPPLGSAAEQIFAVMGPPRNGVFFTFLFTAIGMALANKQFPGSARAYGLAAILLWLLAGAEILLLYFNGLYPRDNHDMQLLSGAAGVLFFLFALRLKPRPRPIYRRLRAMSILIYLLHIGIWLILHTLAKLPGLALLERDSISRTAIVLCVTVLTSYAITRLAEHGRFSWMAALYQGAALSAKRERKGGVRDAKDMEAAKPAAGGGGIGAVPARSKS